MKKYYLKFVLIKLEFEEILLKFVLIKLVLDLILIKLNVIVEFKFFIKFAFEEIFLKFVFEDIVRLPIKNEIELILFDNTLNSVLSYVSVISEKLAFICSFV